MIDTIKIKIDKDHKFICNSYVISRVDENNVSQMEITFDESLINNWAFIDFVKPDGTKYKTPKLSIVDNVAIYDIPNGLIDLKGILRMQVVLQNNEEQIWKSDTKIFMIEDSINATDDIQDKEDFINQAQSILDEIENALTPTIGENGNWYLADRDTGKPSKGVDGADGKDGIDGVDGKDYEITNEDYEKIGSIVEANVQPTLSDNLKESKDYTDNAITKDFKDISYNEKTGTFIFTRHDNTTLTVDLPIEQTVKNGRYDDTTNELILVLVSGQEIKIPVTGLIDDYNGTDTATIQCVVSADNKITCNIKSGSISKTLLTADLQSEINNKVNKTSFVYDVETETLSITI